MAIITVDDIKKLPEADLIVNHIVDGKKKGLYRLILVHGTPGSGKSSVCFRLAELTQEKYPDKKVTIRLIKNLKDFAKFSLESKADEVWIAVIDEIGVLFPSRRVMSGTNVDMAAIIDTIRKKEAIVLANAPLWTAIDSHMRQLANVYIETLKVYRAAGIVTFKFFKLQTNIVLGKTFFHSFKRDGKEVSRTYCRKPNSDTWAAYEKEKDDFMAKLYDKICRRADKREEDERKELGMPVSPPQHELELNNKRDVWMQAHRRNPKNNRIICDKCGSGHITINKERIHCRACEHDEYIKL